MTGSTSRLRTDWVIASAPQASTVWRPQSGGTVLMPCHVQVSFRERSTVTLRLDAVLDAVRGRPTVVQMTFASARGLDLDRLENAFRWRRLPATVLDLLAAQAADGKPYHLEHSEPGALPPAELTDDFLTGVAEQYVALGRGYAPVLADRYGVPRRTIVRWIELSRARGILSPAPGPGRHGGHVITH